MCVRLRSFVSTGWVGVASAQNPEQTQRMVGKLPHTHTQEAAVARALWVLAVQIRASSKGDSDASVAR